MPIGGVQGGSGVAWCERVKHPNVKKCTLPPVSQNPCARTSRQASSPEMAVLDVSLSPVSGCRAGSISTLGQTSVSSFAVKSLMLLCRMEGSPPQGQLSAYSVEKVEPQTQCEGR